MKTLTAAAFVAICSLPMAAQAQDWTGFYGGGLQGGIADSGSGLAGGGLTPPTVPLPDTISIWADPSPGGSS